MFLPIVFPSAAEFWLKTDPDLIYYAFNNRRLCDLPDDFFCAAPASGKMRQAARDILRTLDLTSPLTLVCRDPDMRRSSANLRIRSCSVGFPPASFFHMKKAGHDLYIACPELCFWQASAKLDRLQLIKLGFDLCSIYMPNEKSEYGQQSRTLITSAELIGQYLNNFNGCKGIKKARHALCRICDFSNSPMETRLAIIAVLPIEEGGYGLPLPDLNYGIRLTPDATRVLGRNELRVDMAWPAQKFAVEYNSNLSHLSADQLTEDANRISVLTRVGYTLITLTAGNVMEMHKLDSAMQLIRHSLGLPDAEKEFDAFRYERRQIYDKLWESCIRV